MSNIEQTKCKETEYIIVKNIKIFSNWYDINCMSVSEEVLCLVPKMKFMGAISGDQRTSKMTQKIPRVSNFTNKSNNSIPTE